jgi:type I restriction enzyme R subunit
MGEDIFQHLLDTGTPHQKTIIFCASDAHALKISSKLNNIYERWCQEEKKVQPREWYAFMCTGNPDLRPPAKKLIPEFRDSKQSHYIATTVDLLSTGVDIPNLENVVFFRYLESPILFYQIVGRGTRIGDPPGSKAMFRLYDYTNATRLFGQPFESRNKPTTTEEDEATEGNVTEGDSSTIDRPTQRRPTLIQVEGFTVSVAGEGKSILCNEDGTDVLVPVEEYKQRVADRLLAEAADLESFRMVWVAPSRRRRVLQNLPSGEVSARLIRELSDQRDCDLYDVLADLAYGVAAKSRAERTAAFTYKNRAWLRELPEPTANVLSAIARQFEKGGIEELETTALFDEGEVMNAGGFEELMNLETPPEELIQQVKLRLLAA